MRRKDREISGRENILAIVNKCEYMTLALCDGGEPYAVTVNFGVLEKEGKLFLCFHCAKEGKKLDIIEKNNRVAFAMTAQYETVKNDLACKCIFLKGNTDALKMSFNIRFCFIEPI